MVINEQKIVELIQAGETDTVEFKAAIPPINVLCKVIAAMANTHGGLFLLGVHEEDGIVGVKPGSSEKVHRAVALMENPPQYKCSEVVINDQTILAVEIQANIGTLTHCQGGLFCRRGDRICLMDAEDIRRHYQDISQYQLIEQLTSSVAVMNKSINELTEQVHKYQEELDKANKKSGISDFIYCIVGVVLGAIIPMIL